MQGGRGSAAAAWKGVGSPSRRRTCHHAVRAHLDQRQEDGARRALEGLQQEEVVQEGHGSAEHGEPPLQMRRWPPLECRRALFGAPVRVGGEEQPVEDGADQADDGDQACDGGVLSAAQTLSVLVRRLDFAVKARVALGFGESFVPHDARRLLLVVAVGLSRHGRHLNTRALRSRLIILSCSLNGLRARFLLSFGDCQGGT